MLGVETDYGESSFLALLDQLFLLVFVVEFSIRALYRGRSLFDSDLDDCKWNLFDASLVVVGILDSWLILFVCRLTTALPPGTVEVCPWATLQYPTIHVNAPVNDQCLLSMF